MAETRDISGSFNSREQPRAVCSILSINPSEQDLFSYFFPLQFFCPTWNAGGVNLFEIIP